MIIKYPSKVHELMTDDCNILSASPSDEDYLNYAKRILEIEKMNNFQLAPCPFCGYNQIEYKQIIIKGLIEYTARCKVCGAHNEFSDFTKAEALDTWQRGYITNE